MLSPLLPLKGAPATSTAGASSFRFPRLSVFKSRLLWERCEFRSGGWGSGAISLHSVSSPISEPLATQVVRPRFWGARGRKAPPPVPSPGSLDFNFLVTEKHPQLLHLSSVQWTVGLPRRMYLYLAFPPPLSNSTFSVSLGGKGCSQRVPSL